MSAVSLGSISTWIVDEITSGRKDVCTMCQFKNYKGTGLQLQITFENSKEYSKFTYKTFCADERKRHEVQSKISTIVHELIAGLDMHYLSRPIDRDDPACSIREIHIHSNKASTIESLETLAQRVNASVKLFDEFVRYFPTPGGVFSGDVESGLGRLTSVEGSDSWVLV
jgi:hypothetical protein